MRVAYRYLRTAASISELLEGNKEARETKKNVQIIDRKGEELPVF